MFALRACRPRSSSRCKARPTTASHAWPTPAVRRSASLAPQTQRVWLRSATDQDLAQVRAIALAGRIPPQTHVVRPERDVQAIASRHDRSKLRRHNSPCLPQNRRMMGAVAYLDFYRTTRTDSNARCSIAMPLFFLTDRTSFLYPKRGRLGGGARKRDSRLLKPARYWPVLIRG